MSKCPKCDKSITQLSFASVPVKQGTFKVNGTLFTCPHCGVVLGAGVDPQTMINTISEAVVATLRKG